MTARQRAGAWLFAAALALRLAALALFPTQTVLDADQVEYDQIAHHLVAGEGYSLNPGVPTSARAPGYTLFLAAVYSVFGRNYWPPRVLNALMGAATAWLLFWVASAAFDERTGKFAGWFCALYPVLIHYEARLQSETLMTLLVLASIPGLLVYVRDGRIGPLAGSGLLIGLATLTRPGTLLFPLGAAPLLALRRPLDWKGPLLYLAVFAAVILPWKLRNHNMFGHWSLCSRGPGFGFFVTGLMLRGVPYDEGFRRYHVLFAQERYSEPKKHVPGTHPYMELERRMQREGKAAIKEFPLRYLGIVAKRFPRFWITSHSGVFGIHKSLGEYRAAGRWGPIAARLALLAFHAGIWALAFFGLYARRDAIARIWPVLFVPVYFTIHIVFDLVPRYHVPALPLVFAFTAAGAIGVFDLISNKLKGKSGPEAPAGP